MYCSIMNAMPHYYLSKSTRHGARGGISEKRAHGKRLFRTRCQTGGGGGRGLSERTA